MSTSTVVLPMLLWLVTIFIGQMDMVQCLRPFRYDGMMATRSMSQRFQCFGRTSRLDATLIPDTEPPTSIVSTSSDSMPMSSQDVLEQYMDEIVSLRGTPELVDRLENLAQKHPGIELNLNLYRAIYPFTLDEFQEQGLSSLMAGNNVLVTTPTGSGKTVVGELAIYFALMMGLRVAYTTPLKALSNQKFQDFTAKYGGDRVGLLTGDIAINRGAPILIMTTEVFRNMIYDQDSENQLSNLFMVCFDEFHFMNDPDRGTVWEESVISCPPSVRILALSATMGNVDEIKGWMTSIHGPTELVISDHRPVPLRYLFAMKQGLMPLFRDPNAGPGARSGVVKMAGKLDAGAMINPSIIRIEEQAVRAAQAKVTRTGRPLKAPKVNPANLMPRYNDLAEELLSLKMLPAIVFIFSRVGCEQSAKLVMQTKTKLLTDAELLYVSQAIAAFARANPEIPISKSSVQMLRAGVGVHHAGLIPVWKAFIEDLFNANKIKVLFATETLAAGVNMPARTTVISTVTKRINSEVIKLKTSQLLQMAGRAGRRGKDTEGTVVIMRNRFEDVRMGHKILTSAVDGIKSHFKTSYGLTVKLLETKTIEECRALIERGFGAYLLQKRVLKKERNEKVEIETYRTILQKYTLKGARDFLKIARRLEKERRNEEFLIQKMIETDNELVQAIADYMPLGIGLQLRSGSVGDELTGGGGQDSSPQWTGFFLGDVKWGATNAHNGFGVMTRSGRLLVVRKEHIRAFAEPDDSISPRCAQDLLDLFNAADKDSSAVWKDVPIPGCNKPILESQYQASKALESPAIALAFEQVRNAKPFPPANVPGSVIRQREIVEELEDEFRQSPVSVASEGDAVLMALRYAAGLKDPVAFVNMVAKDGAGGGQSEGDVFAWRMFCSVLKVLQQFEALNEDTSATDLGRMVGSLSADNELWLALVLRRDSVQQLTAAELGAVMCSIVVDGYKASNAYFKYRPSDNVEAVYNDLEQLSWDLKLAQTEANIEFPVHLSREAGGMVESWINGVTWRELCRDTSLDQGDLCRMLRRTVEVLRQIPQAYGVPGNIAQVAYEAADKMDRFPVADVAVDATGALEGSSTSGVGFSVEESIARGIAIAQGTEDDESMSLPGDGSGSSLLLDPLSLLFDGDEEEGGGSDVAAEGLFGANGGGSSISSARDREIRRKLGLLDDDDDDDASIRNEISALIADIEGDNDNDNESATNTNEPQKRGSNFGPNLNRKNNDFRNSNKNANRDISSNLDLDLDQFIEDLKVNSNNDNDNNIVSSNRVNSNDDELSIPLAEDDDLVLEDEEIGAAVVDNDDDENDDDDNDDQGYKLIGDE